MGGKLRAIILSALLYVPGRSEFLVLLGIQVIVSIRTLSVEDAVDFIVFLLAQQKQPPNLNSLANCIRIFALLLVCMEENSWPNIPIFELLCLLPCVEGPQEL